MDLRTAIYIVCDTVYGRKGLMFRECAIAPLSPPWLFALWCISFAPKGTISHTLKNPSLKDKKWTNDFDPYSPLCYTFDASDDSASNSSLTQWVAMVAQAIAMATVTSYFVQKP